MKNIQININLNELITKIVKTNLKEFVDTVLYDLSLGEHIDPYHIKLSKYIDLEQLIKDAIDDKSLIKEINGLIQDAMDSTLKKYYEVEWLDDVQFAIEEWVIEYLKNDEKFVTQMQQLHEKIGNVDKKDRIIGYIQVLEQNGYKVEKK